jgi:hypothetical protein
MQFKRKSHGEAFDPKRPPGGDLPMGDRVKSADVMEEGRPGAGNRAAGKGAPWMTDENTA